jgi:hypothetical protein
MQLAFDFVTSNPMPVELLRDGRGVYGIGISDFYRKVRPHDYDLKKPHTLILRPDRFDDTPPVGAVLQKIIGGFRRGIFHDSLEEKFLHHEALRRAGLPWPPPHHYSDLPLNYDGPYPPPW